MVRLVGGDRTSETRVEQLKEIGILLNASLRSRGHNQAGSVALVGVKHASANEHRNKQLTLGWKATDYLETGDVEVVRDNSSFRLMGAKMRALELSNASSFSRKQRDKLSI